MELNNSKVVFTFQYSILKNFVPTKYCVKKLSTHKKFTCTCIKKDSFSRALNVYFLVTHILQTHNEEFCTSS